MFGSLINNDVICYCFISHLVERGIEEKLVGVVLSRPLPKSGLVLEDKVHYMTGYIYFLFSSPEAGNPAVAVSEHPLFPSPLTSLSLSDASRLSADPYSWRDAGLSEGSCAASDSQQGEGYRPEAELQHLQQATQKQDRTWAKFLDYVCVCRCPPGPCRVDSAPHPRISSESKTPTILKKAHWCTTDRPGCL
ncbi:hypothetical protein PO909_010899 [Leuciscus waleckii]